MKTKLNRPYSIQKLVESLKKDGYLFFTDENARLIDIDLFCNIFRVKYGSTVNFFFTVNKIRQNQHYKIVAQTMYGFEYHFPIDKS